MYIIVLAYYLYKFFPMCKISRDKLLLERDNTRFEGIIYWLLLYDD